MSLDDIDEKLKKVAKSFSDKNKKTQPDPSLGGTPLEEKDKYEDSFQKRQTSGLLSVFENHLGNQLKSKSENDEEFRTIDLSTTETTTTENVVEKVTEDEINSLIKVTDKNTATKDESKQNITVDNQVYTQKKYGDIHETIDNVASASDLNIVPEKVTEASILPQQQRYSDTKETIDNSASQADVSAGLPPVNKIVKESEGETPQTKTVDPKVLEHIKAHRAKRDAERGTLPDNYQVESKN